MKNTIAAIETRESAILDLCIDTLDYCDDNLFDFVCEMIRLHGRESFLGMIGSLAEYCYSLAERLLFAEFDSEEPSDERIEYLSGAMHFLEKA